MKTLLILLIVFISGCSSLPISSNLIAEMETAPIGASAGQIVGKWGQPDKTQKINDDLLELTYRESKKNCIFLIDRKKGLTQKVRCLYPENQAFEKLLADAEEKEKKDKTQGAK